MRARLYFDNAATSFPKPPGVHDAMLRYAHGLGAPARGRYAEAVEAGALVQECRERIARLLSAAPPEHVVFTLNTSDALNLAIKGIVGGHRHSGDGRAAHVITTWMDHNSVLRPYNAIVEDGVTQTRVQADPRMGVVDPGDIRAAIRNSPAGSKPVLVSILHASNVTGVIQPVAEIGRVCRELGVPLLVDAAQSIGHVRVDVEEMYVDLLAFAGHKGMLGPTGTGGLWIRPGIEKLMRTVREGGTGSRSELDTQPTFLPDRFEPGSPNTLGIVGLSEGVAYLLEQTIEGIRAHEVLLMRKFVAALGAAGDGLVPGTGLRLVGPVEPEARVGVFSFVHDALSPVEVADRLESEFGILCRAGLHCAPLAHRLLGTEQGATRLSFGAFLSVADVEYAAAALREVGAGTGATVRKPIKGVATRA